MVCVNEVLDFLWKIAPEEGKEPWDNVGHLVGRGGAPVTKILTAGNGTVTHSLRL